MLTVEVEKRLLVPGPDVWEVIDDFGSHHNFNPFIERCAITNGVPMGEGAERVVDLYDGSVLRQRIVDYRPGRGMVIEVVESSQLVRHHLVEIAVDPEDDRSCRLGYRVTFRSPLGALGYPIGLYHKAVLRSRYALVLRGIERYVGELREARGCNPG